MNRSDLFTMYRRELAELMERNGLKSTEDALMAAINEVYASLHLFGRKPTIEIPDGFDLEQFRKDFGNTLHRL